MKQFTLIAGPLLALAVGSALAANGQSPDIAWTAAVTCVCAVWWIFEPIPIPATSLIPIAVLPLVGVLEPREVGAAYGDKLILLLLGGLMLSSAMEKSGAHRRIALTMVRAFGGSSSRRLVFGFMAASGGLSMWISNLATALMLLPIVMAVVERVAQPRLRTALLLGVAYAASVGGVGTPVGTPPNLIFMQNYEVAFGEDAAPSFTEWMTWAVPIVAVMLPLVGLWLTRGLNEKEEIELPEVGRWRTEEVRTLAVFAVTALLWITRKEPYDGWSEWLNLPAATDASVALLGVVAMFLIPNGVRDEQGRQGRLLDWETAGKIPWGILLLFSAGIVIARAFAASGLSQQLGEALAAVGGLPLLLLTGMMCLSVTFLTEVTSNTATTNLLMPILAAAATSAGIDPRTIMVPAAISASFAFMLPVATGPNAVVFSSGQLTVREMAREGLALNLMGVVVVTLVCYLQFG